MSSAPFTCPRTGRFAQPHTSIRRRTPATTIGTRELRERKLLAQLELERDRARRRGAAPHRSRGQRAGR
ncbi:hypothetical protein BMW24_008685 [Mycobacterium heckeshornense]|nr:hypothetical protein ACT16_22940 [Mycobacterium heckeshornense]PIJ35829.1 hypothetical protein BMW24_008685 [Mycobacterium heckeshornense]